MVNLFDLALLHGGNVLVVVFMVLCARRGRFYRYLGFNVFLVAILVSSAVRQISLHSFGLWSTGYLYAYYLSDFFLIILQCFVLLDVFETSFRDSSLWAIPHSLAVVVRMALIASLATLIIADLIHSGWRFTRVERDLYFVTTTTAMLVWATLVNFRANDAETRMLVCAFGLCAALSAAQFAMGDAVPSGMFVPVWAFLRRIGPAAFFIRLVLWCYAVWPRGVAQQIDTVSEAAPSAEPIQVSSKAGV